jgi:hypothetical protein
VSKKDEIIDALVTDTPIDNTERRWLLRFGGRLVITLLHFALFVMMVIMLFYEQVPDSSRDLISAFVGLLIGSQREAISWFFKDNHPPEKE